MLLDESAKHLALREDEPSSIYTGQISTPEENPKDQKMRDVAIPVGMVRTAWKGVRDSYCGRKMHLFNASRSTHNLMPFPVFGTSTIGCTHAVSSVTFLMIPWASSDDSSSLRLGNSGSATGREPGMATGVAPSISCK